MNYLAHLYLADRVGADLAGGVLGDFVRGPDLSRFDDAVALSIRLHRRIDTLTDHHPLTLAAIARYPEGPQRRYATVIMDVLFDYVLATDWQRYSGESFVGFCNRGAKAVTAASSLFSAETSRRPTRTGFSALLLSYATEIGIDLTLRRIAARLKKPEPMLEACVGWQDHIGLLREELPLLMADLETGAKAFLQAPPA